MRFITTVVNYIFENCVLTRSSYFKKQDSFQCLLTVEDVHAYVLWQDHFPFDNKIGKSYPHDSR